MGPHSVEAVESREAKCESLGSQIACVQILVWLLVICGTLGELYSLSMSQFPHL